VKGSQVYITGEAKIAKWEGNDGVERSALECVVQNIKLCGKKSDSSAPAANKKPAAVDIDDDDIAF
jgi:single-stranded DNA-binding protein